MTMLRTSTLILALAMGAAGGAHANDMAVPQTQNLVQETRTLWSPGFVSEDNQYVRLVRAQPSRGEVTRLVREERSTWKVGFHNDGEGRYIRESITHSPSPSANVAHFEDHPSPGAVRDDRRHWVHFD